MGYIMEIAIAALLASATVLYLGVLRPMSKTKVAKQQRRMAMLKNETIRRTVTTR
jgi:hypothetical protein